jgi:hypothetical protein
MSFIYPIKNVYKKSKGNRITPDSGEALAQRNTEPTYEAILIGTGFHGRLFVIINSTLLFPVQLYYSFLTLFYRLIPSFLIAFSQPKLHKGVAVLMNLIKN